MAKLLLVEDNEMNRDMLSRRLIKKGFEVEILNSKNLGLITELTIKVLGHSETIKILIFTNILEDLVRSKKLLFNKEWAFVFPKS